MYFSTKYKITCILLALALMTSCASRGEATGAERSVTEIELDSASLYLQIRGSNKEKPVMLWLHGGPGGAERPLFQLYNAQFESEFVVAYLDQRGAGRSYNSNADSSLLNVNQHLSDLDSVVDYLCTTYEQTSIILVGHSWGATLGLLYAQKHPVKVKALILAAPLIATAEGQRRELAFIRQQAAKHDETKRTEKALSSIGSPPLGWEEDLIAQRLTDRYGGVYHQPLNRWMAVLSGTLKGLVWPWEIPGYIKGNNTSLKAMNAELGKLDLRKTVNKLDVPVLFALGRYDHVTDSDLAVEFIEQLDTARKHVKWFEHSAHNIPFEEPEKFFRTVSEFVQGSTSD